MRNQSFPPLALERLGYYVYVLLDPETNAPFYIGKGTGNRVFDHLRAALKDEEPSDKLDQIRRLHSRGLRADHVIIRHGLSEKEAFEIEAALIDYVGLNVLSNRVRGMGTRDRGAQSADEIIEHYAAPRIAITEPAILIVVNRLYRYGMDAAALYEATRGFWRVGPRRERAHYALAVYNGIVREVYRITGWYRARIGRDGEPLNDRWYFDGEVASELQGYVGGSVANYRGPKTQNPITYVNL